ncbi:YbjN domain-containing protein [Streptomyces sp. NPDC059037]|uniref:YbjN domain-containing protein n=1 Tax=unclassified Streptomyces TaxID=2593676 RepID=UPI0033FBD13F
MATFSDTWRQLLHDYAREKDYRYQVSGDTRLLQFSVDNPGRDSVTLLVADIGEMVHFSMTDSGFIPKDKVPLAVAAVNQYNQEHLLPKAYVYENDSGQSDLHGGWTLPGMLVVTPAQFSEIMDWALSVCLELFDWLHEHYGL